MLRNVKYLWVAIAALTAVTWAASDDPEFLSRVVAKLDTLHRVTDAPHRMAGVLARGRIDSCIECHQQYAATDYVTRAYMKSK